MKMEMMMTTNQWEVWTEKLAVGRGIGSALDAENK
jgi:hypothetical protein